MPAPLAFISYRRADSSAASRWLATSIARTFGPESVFIDTEAIRMSDDWPSRIEDALEAATLVIPVIGPRWLEIADEYHRRRIDDASDWVHTEIAHAIARKKRILPVLLSRTPMPRATALPPPLASLSRVQAFELRDERWEADLDGLLAELETFGFARATLGKIRYPTPMVSLTELTAAELQEGLGQLSGWKALLSQSNASGQAQRAELAKTYEFASFDDAIRFMSDAVPKINEMQHHPRWENVWRSVSVYLSTWDIGHKPSRLDLELAAYLDDLRSKFPAPRRRG